jgi:hypothetical protein
MSKKRGFKSQLKEIDGYLENLESRTVNSTKLGQDSFARAYTHLKSIFLAQRAELTSKIGRKKK